MDGPSDLVSVHKNSSLDHDKSIASLSPSTIPKPPLLLSPTMMRTPEQRVSMVLEAEIDISPSDFLGNGLEGDVSSIGMEGVENLSPIAPCNLPSPAQPTSRRTNKKKQTKEMNARSPSLSPHITQHRELSVIGEEEASTGSCTGSQPLQSSPAFRTRSRTRKHSSSPKVARETSINDELQLSKDELHQESDAIDDAKTEATGPQDDLANSMCEISITDDSRVEHEEIEAAQNLVGVSSRCFIEQLRGAAFRRKMNLARSRDSLVAKEKVQREAIAASKTITNSASNSYPAAKLGNISEQGDGKPPACSLQEQENNHIFKARSLPSSTKATGASGIPRVQKRPSTIPRSPNIGKPRRSFNMTKSRQPLEKIENTTFKALSLPKTTGSTGQGGQVGVVQVKKRPPTIPISPKLGPHKSTRYTKSRSSLPLNAPLNAPSGKHSVFKARPIPRTTGNRGHGGLWGVAKVPKRQITTAISPLLGARRRKTVVESSKNASTQSNDSSLQKQQLSTSDLLLGVDFLDTPSAGIKAPPRRRHTIAHEFIPHSTLRAQKRAEFEVERRKHETERDEEERLKLRAQVGLLNQELCSLREKI